MADVQEEQQQQHILVATFPGQGHINPALHLANRLAHFPFTDVTFSTTISGHRRMFPTSTSELHHNRLTFSPFSDGHDDGITRSHSSFSDYFPMFNRLGPLNFSNILHSFAARGHPVTCIIYTILLPWVADVAGDHGIPCFLYWIQASTVFSVYQHFLHGYETLISAHAHDPLFTLPFPNLKPSLQIRDLPSFCTMSPDHPFYSIFETLKGVFQKLDQSHELKEGSNNGSKPKVLVNSFAELEPDVDHVDEVELMPVGPVLPFLFEGGQEEDDEKNLFKVDDHKRYMEWLDTKKEGSVVYVSFGSFWEFKKEHMEEILRGLKGSKRPYLWVVRKDNREKELLDDQIFEDGINGMMVEWCSQVRVLAHRAVGCFVTHCGWNSTLESLACGVPMVCVPQWTDQGMNAKLVESLWGCGVRTEVHGGDGVVRGEELVRCLELVMGDGEKGVEIRTQAKMWKDKALEAVGEGGSSDLNLKAFVDGIKRFIK